MPRPTPIPVRQVIYERALRGESPAVLAAAFAMPVRTVRHLCRRFRERGADAVRPDYRAPAAPPPHAFGPEAREAALALRRAHPTWGAGLIRVALAQQDPEARWPAVATLRRWFRRAGLGPAPPPRRPRPPSTRATAPHQTWQMDACEHIALADGSRVSRLRVVDECTGAVLGTTIFPPGDLEPGRPRGHAGGPPPALRPLGAAGGAAGR